MRLYNFRHSPNPLKVRFAMAELGLNYETVEINLFEGDHRKPGFAEVNPFRAVPVLEDEGRLLRESNAILAWLGKRNGKTLWPRDPALEAEALQWMFFEAAHLQDSCGTLWWNDVVIRRLNRPQWAQGSVTEAAEDLAESLGVLEEHFRKHRYMVGDDFTLADCSVGVTLNMLRGTRMGDMDEWPRVHAYVDAIADRRAWDQADGWAIHRFAIDSDAANA